MLDPVRSESTRRRPSQWIRARWEGSTHRGQDGRPVNAIERILPIKEQRSLGIGREGNFHCRATCAMASHLLGAARQPWEGSNTASPITLNAILFVRRRRRVVHTATAPTIGFARCHQGSSTKKERVDLIRRCTAEQLEPPLTNDEEASSLQKA